MAIRGTKPKATVVKLLHGNPGHRRLPQGEPTPGGQPAPPLPMTGRPAALWRRYVAKAFWLTAADSPAAWLWCQMQAEAEEDPKAMLAARIGQLRALSNELGFNPSARARLAPVEPGAGDEWDGWA